MDERVDCCRYEPSLDDLLDDEVMQPVLRSAGFDPHGFREMMVETARRIDDRDRPRTTTRAQAGPRRPLRRPGSGRRPAGNSIRTLSPG